MGLIRKAGKAFIFLIQDTIDRLGDPSLVDTLNRAKERGAELALENARLECDNARLTEQLNRLRDEFDFNGPTLYSDEVEALKRGYAALMAKRNDHDEDHADAISRLIQRSDHTGITAQELMRRAHNAINGIAIAEEETARWNSPSVDSRIPEEFWEDIDKEPF